MDPADICSEQFTAKRLCQGTWQQVRCWYFHITTTVTCLSRQVDFWIQDTRYLHRRRLHNLVVGLDTDWCLPSPDDDYQKVAVIQLCVGRRCLIFQLCHKDGLPLALSQFLADKGVTFVGKGVENDGRKLLEDYGLWVRNLKDVGRMAYKRYRDREYLRLGLRGLVFEVLSLGMEKPKEITMSEWDVQELSERQVQYAAIDGFVSYKLGVELMKPSTSTSTSTSD